MAYLFSQTNKLSDEFMNVFGIGFKPFYDGLISIASKQLCIDILKFDEWLRQQHGNYEDEGKSMDDIIREHYGEKGVKLIKEVTDMGDFKLTDGTVRLTGVKTVADRTVCKETVTYRPHGSSWDSEDVNDIVYDMMIIAGYDMLSVGSVVFGGNYTAAEMAGSWNRYISQYEEGDYKTVSIVTKTFCCNINTRYFFSMMAEWEGQMGLAPKKCHRFYVEGAENVKEAKLKAYTRHRGYKPTTISLVYENTRIAKNLKERIEQESKMPATAKKKAEKVTGTTYTVKDARGRNVTFGTYIPGAVSEEMSMAEQLRQALLNLKVA